MIQDSLLVSNAQMKSKPSHFIGYLLFDNLSVHLWRGLLQSHANSSLFKIIGKATQETAFQRRTSEAYHPTTDQKGKKAF